MTFAGKLEGDPGWHVRHPEKIEEAELIQNFFQSVLGGLVFLAFGGHGKAGVNIAMPVNLVFNLKRKRMQQSANQVKGLSAVNDGGGNQTLVEAGELTTVGAGEGQKITICHVSRIQETRWLHMFTIK